MNAKRLALLLVCLLPACLPASVNETSQNNNAPIANATANPTPTRPVDATTLELVAEYLALQSVPGQFNGGEWNEDVDRWMGRKHTVMLELSARLSNGDFSCMQLTDLLPEPDHIVQGGDPLHDLIQTLPAYQSSQNDAVEFLVYEWRGTHDFLFFVCENGRITGSGWWYAGE